MELAAVRYRQPWLPTLATCAHVTPPSFCRQGSASRVQRVVESTPSGSRGRKASRALRCVTKRDTLDIQDSRIYTCPICSCGFRRVPYRCTYHSHCSDENFLLHRPGRTHNQHNGTDALRCSSIDCICCSDMHQIECHIQRSCSCRKYI